MGGTFARQAPGDQKIAHREGQSAVAPSVGSCCFERAFAGESSTRSTPSRALWYAAIKFGRRPSAYDFRHTLIFLYLPGTLALQLLPFPSASRQPLHSRQRWRPFNRHRIGGHVSAESQLFRQRYGKRRRGRPVRLSPSAWHAWQLPLCNLAIAIRFHQLPLDANRDTDRASGRRRPATLRILVCR